MLVPHSYRTISLLRARIRVYPQKFRLDKTIKPVLNDPDGLITLFSRL